MNNRRKSIHFERRGHLYIVVLLTSLLVSTIGLVALANASLRLRASAIQRDYLAAQALAASAIELGLQEIRNNPDWRDDLDHDREYPDGGATLAPGTITWKLLDEDEDLEDDDSDSVRLVGIGRVGNAVAAESVRLLPSGQPLGCLESSLHCNANLSIAGTGLYFKTNQRISSNGNVSVSGLLTSLDGSAEAVGSVSGTISGDRVEGVASRRMPGSSVFDYYLDNGTPIDISHIPLVDGRHQLQACVLAPAINPFGPKNPEGIYIIDCRSADLTITNCRIHGTLLLLNPGSATAVDGSVRWDAAVSNYPALLVRGNLLMRLSSEQLSEGSLGVNFNPPDAPYAGIGDLDSQDAYPSEINGIVYVSGELNAVADLRDSIFRGVVVCASMRANSNCRFTYRPMLAQAPPPGFASDNPMLVSPGSRRQETLPSR